MTYNYVNAALCSLAPLCAQKFRVTGDVDVWTDIDFAAEKMKIDTELSITIRLAQIVHMGLAVAFGALGILIKNKLRLRRDKKEAKRNQSEKPDTGKNIETNTQETIQAEERKESHG
jgi:hypothetical protein